jgi:hypothetical protein
MYDLLTEFASGVPPFRVRHAVSESLLLLPAPEWDFAGCCGRLVGAIPTTSAASIGVALPPEPVVALSASGVARG